MSTAPRLSTILCLLTAICLPIGFASGQNLPDTTRLLRFPATNGQQIVFSYAGQLYTVPMEGGTARRLTSGPGYTSFPRFSPDGKQLAFTAQYDGNTEVYVMPAEGGAPKRLTYTATLGRDDISDRMGPNNIVMGWKNTKPLDRLPLAHATRSTHFIGQLYTVGLDADLPQQLPVPRGGFASFSPDDSKMAYNRVFREFRTWKHYRGGMADDIWIYDFKTGTIENITNNPAQDIIPMWAPDNQIYFLSDRDNRMNLYSLRPRDQGDEAAHHIQGLRHQVSRRSARTRSSSSRPATSGASTSRPDKRRRCRSISKRISLPVAPPSSMPRSISNPSTCARRQTRRRRRARRYFFRAGQGRRYPQPDQDFRRARARRRLVAGRQMDRLRLRRDRRERALRPISGRQGPAATGDERRRHLLLSADLVAR